MDPRKYYYLPVHGVIKEQSSTTKLRAIFDGSAKTDNDVSLNDQLLPGPSLYPPLSSVINKFRLPAIVITGDVSKIFREISLDDLNMTSIAIFTEPRMDD